MLRQSKNLPPAPEGRIGSGVIIDANKGYIVTNAHVVENAESIEIVLSDTRQFKAKLIGSDTDSDIAVLQINAKNLTSLPIANSDTLQVGDFVAAIGSPFGLNQTVTSGIISALQRENISKGNLDDFIQTDAPINPGNSGGALVNMQGEFIGMNTAIITPDGGNTGIGFAIPSNVVINIAKQLIKYSKVVRGIIGVMAQNVTPDIASSLNVTASKGALVSSVNDNSPAQEAGIQVGDIITAIDDQPIDGAGELVSKMGLYRAGSKVKFTIIRNHQAETLSVMVAPPEQVMLVAEHRNPYLNGLILQNIKEYDPIQGDIAGIAVVDVAKDSNAERAGLQAGDIIISANLKPVHVIKDFKDMTDRTIHPILLNVIRNSEAIFIVLKPADDASIN
jgi:serine protease Do